MKSKFLVRFPDSDMVVFLSVIIAVIGIALWTDDFVMLQGERTAYSAGCTQGAWLGDRCTEKLVAAELYRFRPFHAVCDQGWPKLVMQSKRRCSEVRNARNVATPSGD
jgi:hypothetical protein